MAGELKKILADWQKEREEAVEWLAKLTDDQLDLKSQPVTLAKAGQFTNHTFPSWTVRQLMERITDHHKDHKQHLLMARRMLGSPRSDVVRILVEMQLVRAELVSSLFGVADELIDKPDWEAGQWSIRQILAHVAEFENIRLRQIRQALGGPPLV